MKIYKRIIRKLGYSPKRSFSLNELDLKLRKIIKKKNGFFIEVGANDGVSQSNTLFFEKYYGWRGLLIEPIPELAEKCVNNRPRCIVENCALVAAYYLDEKIQMHYCNLMTVVSGYRVDETEYIDSGVKFLLNGENDYLIQVPALTLNALFEKHQISHVDLFSLDVEGYEAEVLKGVDFEKNRIEYLLIEVRHKDKERIEKIISPFYRPVAVLSKSNCYSDILYRNKLI